MTSILTRWYISTQHKLLNHITVLVRRDLRVIKSSHNLTTALEHVPKNQSFYSSIFTKLVIATRLVICSIHTHTSIHSCRSAGESLLQHPTTFITENGATHPTIHPLGQALTGLSLPYRRERSAWNITLPGGPRASLFLVRG